MQDLNLNFPITDGNGNPTQYFIRFLQERGIGQGDLEARKILAGAGIGVTGGPTLGQGDFTISADLQAMLNALSTSRGAIIYRGAAAWAALAPGTAGYFLQTLGAGADPAWASAAANIQTLLDSISSTQGAILYRGASGWVALSPGTSGQLLQTGGAGANPSWITASGGGWTSLINHDFGSSAASTKEVDVTGYSAIQIACAGLVHAAAVFRSLQFSINGGSTWYTTSGDYQEISTAGVTANAEALLMTGTTATAARTCFAMIMDNTGRNPVTIHLMTRGIQSTFVGSATVVNRIRLCGVNGAGGVNAGNFTAGTFRVRGAA